MNSPTIDIDGRTVGYNEPVYLAAEAGTTANGSVDKAKRLIDAAKAANMDAIKFQTVDPEQMMSDKAVSYTYSTTAGKKTVPMYEMIKHLMFSEEEWHQIFQHCRDVGISCHSTTDYYDGVDLLDRLQAPAHKLSSWDTTYYGLIEKMANSGKPVIIDLGPCTFPQVLEMKNRINRMGNSKIIFLHDFHTDIFSEMNMRTIPYLKQTIPDVLVGYSAPGRDQNLDICAVALGACYIEKRITLDKSDNAHHHAKSIEPDELVRWVEVIREIDQSLGKLAVVPSAGDLSDAEKYFRSLCATRDIAKGEVFSAECIDAKRPGTGIEFKFIDKFLGKPAKKAIKSNQLLSWDDL